LVTADLSSPSNQSTDQRHQEQDEEKVEQKPRDAHCCGRNTEKAESRSYQRHNEKSYCPSQHNASFRVTGRA
jgi:hypothetical protein